MAYHLVDGTRFALGTTLGSVQTLTALTNATTAVASVAAHGLTAKTPFIMKSGWEEINDTVLRVSAPAAGTFELENLDTTDTLLYPTGAGGGTIQAVTGWTEIPQVLNANPSGGEQQFVDVEPLAQRYGIRIPSRVSAAALEFEIGTDISLPQWNALLRISNAKVPVPIRKVSPGGTVAYGYGYFFLSQMSQSQKGQVEMSRAALTTMRPFVQYLV